MRSLRQLSLYVALFLSGAAALAYQTTWGRMLDRVFGVGDLAVATVLATFFLGLGLGSAFGGKFASRLTRPAWAYAALELGIGVWALLSLLLVPNVHGIYASVGAGASFAVATVIRFTLALLLLLPPTILMGATLPVLIRVVARAGANWSTQATALYVVNTLGAATGAGLTGLYLLPQLGNRMTLICAASASIAGGVLVLALFRSAGQVAAESASARVPDREDAAPSAEREDAPPSRPPLPSRVVLACVLASMAGLTALAGEVLWTRVLRIVVHGTTPAFASMLVCYLVGIAAGSVVADRIGRGRDPARVFGVLQLSLALLTVFAMWLAPHLPRVLGLASGEADLDPYDTWSILTTAAVLLLPLSLILGTSIPLAWRLAGGGAESAASYAGRVLAWNTLGGLVGSVLAGFVFVPLIGIEACLMTVAILHLVTTSVALIGSSKSMLARLTGMLLPAAVAVGVFLLHPTISLPFLLHARNDATNAIIEGPSSEFWETQIELLIEGRNTTVTVTDEEGLLRLYNDGRPESGFGGDAPGFGAELSTLGSLPTLFAPRHERAMVVGLGAAHTTAVMLGGPWEHLDVVELEEAVVEAARYLYDAEGKPFPLDDERAHLVIDDARARLVLAEPGTYDAIVSQPSHPWLAGSSALYTQEFFEECKRALVDDGVLALWVNLFRTDIETLETVTATLRSVFPYGHAFVVEDSSFILVASAAPIPMDERVAERIRAPELRPYLEPQGLDHIIDYAGVRELDPTGYQAFGRGRELIHDDRPLLEFILAQTPSAQSVAYTEIDFAARDTPWISPEAFMDLPERYRISVLIARLREVERRMPGLERLEDAIPALVMSDDERHLILGKIADARGNVRLALEHFDASSDRDAAYAADELRYAERAHYRLVEVASAREALPDRARPFLSAALATRSPAAMTRALEVARELDDPDERELLAVVAAFLAGGCEGLLGAEETPAVSRNDEFVAYNALRCAYAAGDEDRGGRYREEHTRLRRALALEEGKMGREAENGGNQSAAIRHFRRSLAANPAHGPSAAALGRILFDRGDESGAAVVLRTAAEAARGLPQSTTAIEGAASSLGISLTE